MVEVTQGVQKRWFKYDSLGRLIRVRQPEQEVNTALNLSDPYNTSGQWTAGFTYDVMGNVLTATDANGVTITNTYDRAGRVKTRSYSGEPPATTTPPVSFYYDGKGLTAPQNPNYAKGKLTKVTSSVSETLYSVFDNLGRLKESSQITDGQTYTSKYTYNFSGALVEEEYPSGRVVRNEFESDGDLLKVSSKKTSASGFVTYVSNFSYTASGGISQMRLGNGLWETAKFNTRLQVTELGLGVGPAEAGLWKTSYEYGELDGSGNVDTAKNTGNIARQTLTVPGTSFVQSYKYDSLYRLTEAKETTGANQNWIQNWGYDRYGNRTGFTQNIAGNTNATNPTIDENTNRFNASQGFGYDKNGNVVNDIDPLSALPRQFIFNGDNKQTEVKRDGVTIGRYYYDGEGKRVKKVTDTETTVFVYSGGKLIAEYSTQISQTPSVNYTTTDHLGSPRIITNELGQVTARRDFMPFGEEIYTGIGARSASLNYGTNEDDIRQKFTGYQKDNETGLDFAEARMYANEYGRFTAVDPLLASGKSANPQTFNRFVYTGNNPIIRIDPNGTDWYIAFNYQKINGKKWLRSVTPFWKDCRYCGRKWGTSGTVNDNGHQRRFETSWAFFDPFVNKYYAVDKYENRPLGEFQSADAAANQVAAWERQAAINFAGGFVNAVSIASSLSGADGLVAETDSNMYAIGQRAGYGAQIAGAVTGVGVLNAFVNRFGKAGYAMFKSTSLSTGTVWDAITVTQKSYVGSVLPKSFDLATNGGTFWVHPNATKHMAEYAAGRAINGTPEAVRLATQVQLESFHAAVSAAAQQGIRYGEKMNVGGWELIFSAPRKQGQLPVIKHALYTQ